MRVVLAFSSSMYIKFWLSNSYIGCERGAGVLFFLFYIQKCLVSVVHRKIWRQAIFFHLTIHATVYAFKRVHGWILRCLSDTFKVMYLVQQFPQWKMKTKKLFFFLFDFCILRLEQEITIKSIHIEKKKIDGIGSDCIGSMTFVRRILKQ